ncbi:hypothetical protein CEXT_393071 [Caerostris extrusa]|uniref:Uncharacterized protein n=1 Tax=Caerostris extrusa TaxID=172846 RepID=A0AAV4VXG4_CAEEX|nr:hypothetical protein CEXT_393071 [Caerostris extrusa]
MISNNKQFSDQIGLEELNLVFFRGEGRGEKKLAHRHGLGPKQAEGFPRHLCGLQFIETSWYSRMNKLFLFSNHHSSGPYASTEAFFNFFGFLTLLFLTPLPPFVI